MATYLVLDDKNELYKLEEETELKKAPVWIIYIRQGAEAVTFKRAVIGFDNEKPTDIMHLQGKTVRVNTSQEKKVKVQTGKILHAWRLEENMYERMF